MKIIGRKNHTMHFVRLKEGGEREEKEERKEGRDRGRKGVGREKRRILYKPVMIMMHLALNLCT